MAQTKRKRRSKHRGNAAGTIEARGRTGRKATAEEQKKAGGAKGAKPTRAERMAQPPTWNRAIIRAATASALLFVLTQIGLFKNNVSLQQAIVICVLAMIIYVPLGYAFDNWMYKRFSKPKA